MTTVIKRARVGGSLPSTVVVRDGVVDDIKYTGGPITDAHTIDANGAELLPGLHDHHRHLRAEAALRMSLPIGDVRSLHELAELIAASHTSTHDGWLRLVGYDSDALGMLDRATLDTIAPDAPPLRVQHRSGHHWVINTRAQRELSARGAQQLPSDGVLWGQHTAFDVLPALVTDAALSALTQAIAGHGIVSITDMSASNTAAEAEAITRACGASTALLVYGQAGHSAERLAGLKLVADGPHAPTLDDMVDAVTASAPLPTAIHAATEEALALGIAAITEARRSTPRHHGFDTVEHAFVCSADAARVLAHANIAVGAHPGFIFSHGDRLATALTADEAAIYQPLRTLREAGVRMLGGTDAPFATSSPWVAMHAAVDRRSRGGVALSPAEALTPEEAFALFSRDGLLGGAEPPSLAPGDPATVSLIDRSWHEARTSLADVGVIATFGADPHAAPLSHPIKTQ